MQMRLSARKVTWFARECTEERLVSFPMVSSRDTFEKNVGAAVHGVPLSTVFHVKRPIAKRRMYKIISGAPYIKPLSRFARIASTVICRANIIERICALYSINSFELSPPLFIAIFFPRMV